MTGPAARAGRAFASAARRNTCKRGYMKRFHNWPLSASSALTFLTISVSLGGAYAISGSFFANVSVSDLRRFGGVTIDDLRAFELWRIPVSQLLHARMLHMLFNALWLLLLGHRLERRIGSLRLLLLWLVAGGLATAASPIGIEAPWNVGTGASQALFAFASCALVLARRQAVGRAYTTALASTYLAIGLILDLVTAGHPKLGHLAGALLGSLLGATFLNLPENPTETTK